VVGLIFAATPLCHCPSLMMMVVSVVMMVIGMNVRNCYRTIDR
jgi:cytochrome bd-type quinol oxidase subunit 2